MQSQNIDDESRQGLKIWDSKDDGYIEKLGRDSVKYADITNKSLKQPSVDNYNELKPKYQWFERPDKENPLEFDSRVRLLYPKDSNNLVDEMRSKMSLDPPIRL